MSELLKLLHQLLPVSRVIENEFNLTVDSVNLALRAAGKEPPMVMLPNFDDHEWTGEALGKVVFDGRQYFHRGTVFIHTPACSRYHLEDFNCKAEQLMSFISHYEIEMMFDGDVLFLAPESSTLTLFHHEGAFAHVQLGE